MSTRQLKSGALLSYASILMNFIVGLVYTPIMLRLLGQSEYGLYSLIGSVVGYLTILDLGLGSAIVRYTARNRIMGDHDSRSNLNGMFLIIYSCIGVLTVIIGFILYQNTNNIFGQSLSISELHQAKIMMILLIFNIAISFQFGVFGSIMQAYEHFVFIKTINIVRLFIAPCIILPLLYLGYNSIAMVVVNTILNVVTLIINVCFCFKVLNIKFTFKNFDIALLKEIAGYSFFVFLAIVVDKVYWSTGQFILGIYGGTVKVAVFAVAIQIITIYISFSTAASGVFLPKITMMVANNSSNNELSNVMIKLGRIQYIIMAFIITSFLLFGQTFITLWAGPNYKISYFIILIIMIPITIPLIQTGCISIINAQNKNAFRSIVYLAIAVLNVLISIPLAKAWGGVGCAIATSSSLIIGNIIIMNVYYHKKLGLNIPLFWKNILVMSVPVLLALLLGYGITLLILPDNILYFIIKAVIFAIIYITLMWTMGINEYEKNLFFTPIKRLLSVVRTN